MSVAQFFITESNTWGSSMYSMYNVMGLRQADLKGVVDNSAVGIQKLLPNLFHCILHPTHMYIQTDEGGTVESETGGKVGDSRDIFLFDFLHNVQNGLPVGLAQLRAHRLV